MKILLVLLSCLPLYAQGHSVTLAWTDTQNPAGTTYRVYRAQAPCVPTPTWTLVAQDITAKTWQDTAVVPRVYCYAVSAFYNALESSKSVPAEASVPSFVPTALTATVVGSQVQLMWTDALNPTVGTTWNVYRAPGLCGGTPSYTQIATALVAKSYTDATASIGNNCYAVTAVDNGVESAKSVAAVAAVPTAAPSALTVSSIQ